MSTPIDRGRVTPMRPGRTSATSAGDAIGFLAPLVAAPVCAAPILAVGSPAGAAATALVYLALLGVAPNEVIGRRLLARAKARRALGLGRCLAGGAFLNAAVVVFLTVGAPPVLLLFRRTTMS